MDLSIDYHVNVLKYPRKMYEQLEKEILYASPENSILKIGGKMFPIPRQHAGQGDPDLNYKFSGLEVPAMPWTPTVLKIKQIIEKLTSSTYNYCLINKYVDGTRSISAHSDDEKQLVKDHPIACLSLGAERSLVFTRNGHEPVAYKLQDNSVIVMKSPTNSLWKHAIPKDPNVKEPRISLTFRRMVLKRKSEDDAPTKKTKLFKKDSCPPDAFHVCDDFFVSVQTFKDEVRVNLRIYRDGKGGFMVPSTNGVSISPYLWELLREQVSANLIKPKSSFVANLELLVWWDKDGVHFQQMKKKEGIHELFARKLTISRFQCEQLFQSSLNDANPLQSRISSQIRHYQLKTYLQECIPFIPKEVDDPDGVAVNSLKEILKNLVLEKISEDLNCEGCARNRPSVTEHDCMNEEISSLVFMYFEKAFAKIDFKIVADLLVKKCGNLISEKFFNEINVPVFLEELEKICSE